MAIRILDMAKGVLTVGDQTTLNDWSSQVRECVCESSWDEDKPVWVLSGESMAGEVEEGWTLKGKIVQDFGQTNSIQSWCLEHKGEQHPFSFTPSVVSGATKKLTGTLVVRPISIGGEAHTKPEADFEFTILGTPVEA